MALPREMPDSAGSVSVVITTYNHAAFLDDAIRSVLRQSVSAAEVIVVDDGSTDQPERVVAAYPQLRLIRQPNQGLSAARNAGLRSARSPKILFLDADDRLCPGAIEAGLACFGRHPEVGFVYGGFHHIDAGGGVTGAPICQDIGPEPHLSFLTGNVVGMHATVLYQRRHLLTIGGFDVTLHRCEDYDVYLRKSRCYGVASHRQTVAEYRRHGASMSSDPLEMLAWAQRVLGRYRPADRAGVAAAAWRRGQTNWRRYYMKEFLSGAAAPGRCLPLARRLVTAALVSPALTGQYVIKGLLKPALSPGARYRLKRLLGRRPVPPPGQVRFGDFNRTCPLSPAFGFERGTPIDRHYIEAFLAAHRVDIRGRVLEVGDDAYCRRFGAGIVRQDVLHVTADNPAATIVGDLAVPGALPAGAFDCLVVTQTLQFIYDLRAAVAELHRALKPGGVLLLTCPGISQVERGRWATSWYWSLAQPAAERLFGDAFGAANVAVAARGNVYAAVCFLQGLAVEEVEAAKLEEHDPAYPILVTVRARKPEAG